METIPKIQFDAEGNPYFIDPHPEQKGFMENTTRKEYKEEIIISKKGFVEAISKNPHLLIPKTNLLLPYLKRYRILRAGLLRVYQGVYFLKDSWKRLNKDLLKKN